MSLRDFLTLPALLMFIIGVLVSGYVMSAVHSAKGRVAG